MEKNFSVSVLIAAAWCGLLAGLLEALAYLRFPLLRNPDLPWIAVLFALAVLIILGCGFALFAMFVPRRPLFAAANLVFLVVAFYDCATVGVADHRERLVLRAVALAVAALMALVAWRFPAGWHRMQRRTLPWLALFALLYTGIPPLRRALRERRELVQVSAVNHSPNVLVIIVDALSADHLSTYGYKRDTCPYLTQLAAQGVRFDNAIAPASWTLPSHASILTGRLPHELGADRPGTALDGRFRTVAEAFQQRGYRTAAFSANWWFFARRLGFGRGFLHFEDWESVTSAVAQTNLGQRVQNVLLKLKLLRTAVGRPNAQDMNRHILGWLNGRQGPFFVVANYMDVHEPYLPPLDCFHRFSKLARPAGEVFIGNPRLDHLSPAEVQNEADAYDASISCLDTQIASLLRDLRERGLMANTILVFTSDHGDGFGEHGLMSHGNSLYRELIHVPLIMVGPGIPQGIAIGRPVSLMWLPSTLLALTGGTQQAFSGPAMNLAWSGGAQPAWPDPVSELTQMYADPNTPNYYGDLESITSTNWHLIVGGKSGEELYKCCEDPTEAHNVAVTNAAVAQVLKAELQAQESGVGAPAAIAAAPANRLGKSPTPVPQPRAAGVANRNGRSAADRQKMNDYLKALGYAPN